MMSTVIPDRSTVSNSASAARMSYEEFLARAEAERAEEWVDGKAVIMAPVSDAHNQLSVFLISILSSYVQSHDLGQILHEPFQMKTGTNLPGRSPDVFVVRKQNIGRIQKTHLQGPADLVVEIISPDSRARDRGEKYYEYEQGGVPEYWLIDPERKQAEFYQRGEDGLYRPVAVGSDGIHRSVVFDGLWIDVRWLWERPGLLDVMRAWKLIE